MTKLSSIFQLWIYKLHEKKNESENYKSLINQNVNTFSPLNKKYSTIFETEGSELNYLKTPLKTQLNKNFYTPFSENLSPIKMQESAQRFKNEKIDELKKHFQKTNLNDNSMLKLFTNSFTLNNKNIVRLSPPKLHDYVFSNKKKYDKKNLFGNSIVISSPDQSIDFVEYSSSTIKSKKTNTQILKPRGLNFEYINNNKQDYNPE